MGKEVFKEDERWKEFIKKRCGDDQACEGEEGGPIIKMKGAMIAEADDGAEEGGGES